MAAPHSHQTGPDINSWCSLLLPRLPLGVVLERYNSNAINQLCIAAEALAGGGRWVSRLGPNCRWRKLASTIAALQVSQPRAHQGASLSVCVQG